MSLFMPSLLLSTMTYDRIVRNSMSFLDSIHMVVVSHGGRAKEEHHKGSSSCSRLHPVLSIAFGGVLVVVVAGGDRVRRL